MTCPSCDSETGEGASFCTQCGASISKRGSKVKSLLKWSGIAFAVLLGMIIILVAIGLMVGEQDSTDTAGRIAFHSHRDGNREIYVMNADGARATRLTDNSAEDGFPAWSPDGNRITFVSDRAGNHHIYTMNADGSEVTRLSDNPVRFAYPSWSPSGNRTAFGIELDGNWEIAVASSSGITVLRGLASRLVSGRKSYSVSLQPRRKLRYTRDGRRRVASHASYRQPGGRFLPLLVPGGRPDSIRLRP